MTDSESAIVHVAIAVGTDYGELPSVAEMDEILTENFTGNSLDAEGNLFVMAVSVVSNQWEELGEETSSIHLSGDAYDEFIRLLEEPPKELTKLKELLQQPTPWEG